MCVVDVLYASVTGNAEEIARRIHAELATHELPQGALLPLLPAQLHLRQVREFPKPYVCHCKCPHNPN